MKCACARVDITPPAGVDLSGYVARRQPSTGAHDPLYAYALYVEEGQDRLLWLHADVIAFEGADARRLKASLAERHGLAPREVMVTATHTHSGPAVVDLLRCGSYSAETVAGIADEFMGLADRVMSRPEPVEVVAGEGSCDLGIHRRPSDNPHTDTRLPVLGFRRPDGTYAAVLALYAMHNVAMSGANTLYSADMAGRAARTLSDALPGYPPVLWLNGACGNINPPSVAADFPRMEGWGDRLAAEARAALAAARPVEGAGPRSAMATLVLAPDAPGPDEADAIALARKGGGGPPTTGPDAWIAEACRAAVDDWRARISSDDPEVRARCSAPADIQVVALGGLVWVGVPGEPFSILNDELRPLTGASVYVVGYANGDVGYLCPAPVYDEGGYEPNGAFVFYGTNPLPRGAFERVRSVAEDLINQL